ncbi:hypothetical protein [Polyangium jinanense]|uniref:Bacterial repeat domain-containing protein n=1 Tax=Polyangium jinanense TaxID=2829994 RepID=A0A9X4AQY4_9BACT|nr:hypothetical protein [Polyangium jinanense]MDC3955258.1 hypothetical protein [Polyangium jinanense]MDC3981559.1 hypothetical protein [Polyangium jinanense]
MTNRIRAITTVAALATALGGCSSRALLFGPEPQVWQPRVEMSGLGSGRVVVEELPEGCGVECLDHWGKGVALRLKAIPDEHSTFVGWAGACSGTGPCELMPDQFWMAATARFADRASIGSTVVASRINPSGAWGLAVTDEGDALVAGSDADFLSRFDAHGPRVFRLYARGASARAVAFDPEGNAIAVGVARRPAGDAAEVAWLGPVGDAPSAFIAKIASHGRVLWSRVVSASLGASLDAVAVDPAGDAYVAGGFQGRIATGDGAFDEPEGTGFLARFRPDGSLAWVRACGGAGARMTSIALTATGEVVAASARHQGEQRPVGAVVLALSTQGEYRWSWHGEPVDMDLDAITPLAGGDVVVGGRVRGPVRLAGQNQPPLGESSEDAIVLRLAPPGVERWAQRFGGPGRDHVTHLGSDGRGRLIATGAFTGPMRFGDHVLESEAYVMEKPYGRTPPPDGFVASFGEGGEPRWATRFGHAGDDTVWAASVDARGTLRLLLEHMDVREEVHGGGKTIWGEHEYALVTRGPVH